MRSVPSARCSIDKSYNSMPRASSLRDSVRRTRPPSRPWAAPGRLSHRGGGLPVGQAPRPQTPPLPPEETPCLRSRWIGEGTREDTRPVRGPHSHRNVEGVGREAHDTRVGRPSSQPRLYRTADAFLPSSTTTTPRCLSGGPLAREARSRRCPRRPPRSAALPRPWTSSGCPRPRAPGGASGPRRLGARQCRQQRQQKQRGRGRPPRCGWRRWALSPPGSP
mmetsp:Transcript_32129/g.86022  ORF Transcript_32129/g.86022 Transcript_32129/m.86022 type:complete len:221 (+) Transcript_32129:118-780(+)